MKPAEYERKRSAHDRIAFQGIKRILLASRERVRQLETHPGKFYVEEARLSAPNHIVPALFG